MNKNEREIQPIPIQIVAKWLVSYEEYSQLLQQIISLKPRTIDARGV